MAYSFACFISYKRPPERNDGPDTKPPIRLQFSRAFQKLLDQFLDTNVISFRDEDLPPGARYPAALSQNLCRSMCMVALVVPEYFESSWCMAEWNAMATFEKKRLGPNKHGLIFPVTCGGNPATLRPLYSPYQDAGDFRDIVAPVKQLDSVRSRKKIKLIADQINYLAKSLPPPECDNFSLNLGPEEINPRIKEPATFGS